METEDKIALGIKIFFVALAALVVVGGLTWKAYWLYTCWGVPVMQAPVQCLPGR